MRKKLCLATWAFLTAIFSCSALAEDMSHHGMSTMGKSGHESAYMAENAAAMARMMAQMDVKPTGDVDLDFVAMMTPHHQGAIDMAVLVIKHGRNEKIRRIAQKIIIDQQQEITAMRMAVGFSPATGAGGDAACSKKCARFLPAQK